MDQRVHAWGGIVLIVAVVIVVDQEETVDREVIVVPEVTVAQEDQEEIVEARPQVVVLEITVIAKIDVATEAQ